ncbi:Alpha/Beta hydrolase protein [Xylaria sp. FL0043]|nr:Alpha/Beta hydrolase protein [Xylaria sp. FL0043]
MRFHVVSAYHALHMLLTIFSWASAAAAAPSSHEAPIPSVTAKNGTINGRYLAEPWDQDVFLGIPYAQPPLGPLRFKWPQPLNETYATPLDASSYGYSCYQDSSTFDLSEDCLTLNVVRPHNVTETSNLPVLVWIHGGGLFAGSSADPQYNLSALVRLSQDSSSPHQPIIAVSINYRLGIFGFLQTPQVLAEGSSANAGLLDQRLALRWVRENIGAFGGDPARVTVWGESAGAQSIALHLHSFGGRADGLFRAAILESGSAIGVALQPLSFYASPVDTLTRAVGCNDASDQLACLRGVAPEKLFAARGSIYWYPLVDGTFLTDYPSALAETNSFIKIPLLLGTNSDEGITFGPTGFNDSVEIYDGLLSDPGFSGLGGLAYQISPASARKLLQLYPNEPSQEPPYDIANDTVFPEKGLQWRRSCAIYGDVVMVAGRRKLCAAYAGARQPVYSYRFATRPWDAVDDAAAGVQHFVNVAFSFQNISGSLGPLPEFQSHKDISVDIGKAYLNFVYWHDPNGNEKGLQTALPHWPTWTTAKPSNMVLNATRPVVEEDNFRERGIAFIQSISRELLA